MRASRAPWWLYFIAASFVGYFTFQIYVYIWGPESLGFDSDHSSGSLLVQKVTPEGAGARAGLRAGDRIVAVGGIAVRTKKSRYDFFRAAANFEPGRPILIEVERQGKTVELTVNFGRSSLRDRDWLDWEILAASMFTFILALMIGVRRPYDPVARITAWFMASMAFDMSSFPSGWASAWRHLPSALGLLLWPGLISDSLLPGLGITFATVFPRTLVRNRWFWIVIWMPMAFMATLLCLFCWRLVYQPNGKPTLLELINFPVIYSGLALCYVLATLFLLGVQYRRLDDVNDRRRMHVLFAGGLLCCLAIAAIVALLTLFQARLSAAVLGTLFTFSLALPVALAYAVLRHRVFDLGLIVRRGLQYALARGALVSAVPILAAILIADLLLHGDQPILAVLRGRGWIYGALAALAAFAYTKRQNWLEALDRRFFREQYDARRLLCEVVEEVHVARSFEQEAPQVTTRIESALHPEFVALLVSEPREKSIGRWQPHLREPGHRRYRGKPSWSHSCACSVSRWKYRKQVQAGCNNSYHTKRQNFCVADASTCWCPWQPIRNARKCSWCLG